MHRHRKQKLGWTILLNIAITVAEYIGGVLSGSLALISDAGHNLSDVVSLILGYLGERTSAKGPDERHTFGMKRAEVLTALLNSTFLLILSFWILYEAYVRSLSPQPISVGIVLVVGSIGLAGNLGSIYVLHSDRNDTINMRAAYLHLFFDALSSVVVIVSAIVVYFTEIWYFDIIASVFIAVMMIWSAAGIIKSALHILMMGVPEDLDINDISEHILKIDCVKGVHSVHLWALNSEEPFFSAHIVLDGRKNCDGDAVIQRANKVLEREFGITHTTIQIENEAMCEEDGVLCKK